MKESQILSVFHDPSSKSAEDVLPRPVVLVLMPAMWVW